MYRGRFERRTDPKKGIAAFFGTLRQKPVLLAALSLMLFLSAIGGTTLSYLTADSKKADNSFVSAAVSCSVDSSNKATNQGTVQAYIRAAVVVNWMDAEGNIYAIAPKEGTDYTVSSTWSKQGDYYYYGSPVDAGKKTGSPVCTVTPAPDVQAPDGFEMVVEIVTEAIQAQGVTDDGEVPAYQDAWGISSIGG